MDKRKSMLLFNQLALLKPVNRFLPEELPENLRTAFAQLYTAYDAMEQVDILKAVSVAQNVMLYGDTNG